MGTAAPLLASYLDKKRDHGKNQGVDKKKLQNVRLGPRRVTFIGDEELRGRSYGDEESR